MLAASSPFTSTLKFINDISSCDFNSARIPAKSTSENSFIPLFTSSREFNILSDLSCRITEISVLISPISCFNSEIFSSICPVRLFDCPSLIISNKLSNLSSTDKIFSLRLTSIPLIIALLTSLRLLIMLLMPVSTAATVSVNFSSDESFTAFKKSLSKVNSPLTSVISSTEEAIFASVSDELPSII